MQVNVWKVRIEKGDFAHRHKPEARLLLRHLRCAHVCIPTPLPSQVCSYIWILLTTTPNMFKFYENPVRGVILQLARNRSNEKDKSTVAVPLVPCQTLRFSAR